MGGSEFFLLPFMFVYQYFAKVLSNQPVRGAKKVTPFVQSEQQKPNTAGKILIHLYTLNYTHMHKTLASFFFIF